MKENLSVQDSNQKLERFKQIVLSDATQLKSEILKEISEERKQTISSAEAEISAQVSLFIEKETEKVANKIKQEISKETFNQKKMLLSKREHIIDSVFSEVKEKLLKFTKSSEYKNLLLEKTRQAKQTFGGKDIEILLRQSDMVYAQDIKQVWGNDSVCNILSSDTVKYGGIIFSSPQTNLIINETFDSKLMELQHDFVKISGLYFG
jgi:vacuolar-type H+-ATPase subunit E/Vma4